jgi:recombinational DNA repair ATPase RecF
MIESIKFDNFKALRDTQLPLAPFTLLLGPNGSGKSTVLQALEAVNNSAAIQYQQLLSVGVDAVPPNVQLSGGEIGECALIPTGEARVKEEM